jgi:hypothetical protein
MRYQQLAKRRNALLVALAVPILVSGCGHGPSNGPDSGYAVIQDSPDEDKPQQLNPSEEVEAQPSPEVVAAAKPKTPAANTIAGRVVGVTDGDKNDAA